MLWTVSPQPKPSGQVMTGSAAASPRLWPELERLFLSVPAAVTPQNELPWH